MKLTVVHKIIDAYQQQIPNLDQKWEALYEYPVNWAKAKEQKLSIQEQVIATFKGTRTQRLWKRERYRPVETLSLFHEEDPEIVQESVNILFNTSRPIQDRIDSFRYMTEQMVHHYKKSHPTSIMADANWDMQWISLLLSAKEPSQFPFYHQTLFFRAAHLLEMRPQPQVDDYERYSKMINIIYKFLDNTDLSTKRKQSLPIEQKISSETPIKNIAVEALALFANIDLFSESR